MEEFNFFGASNGASPFDSLNGDSQSFPSSPQPDAPFAEAKGVGKSQEPEPRSATTESVPASLFGNPPVILSQDSDPFNSGAFGGSPMEKHGFPHQNHFTQLNGHVTTSNDAAPGSASKTQSSSTAETQPAATHNDKTDDLPDLFGAQASEFDSFLQPPASAPFPIRYTDNGWGNQHDHHGRSHHTLHHSLDASSYASPSVSATSTQKPPIQPYGTGPVYFNPHVAQLHHESQARPSPPGSQGHPPHSLWSPYENGPHAPQQHPQQQHPQQQQSPHLSFSGPTSQQHPQYPPQHPQHPQQQLNAPGSQGHQPQQHQFTQHSQYPPQHPQQFNAPGSQGHQPQQQHQYTQHPQHPQQQHNAPGSQGHQSQQQHEPFNRFATSSAFPSQEGGSSVGFSGQQGYGAYPPTWQQHPQQQQQHPQQQQQQNQLYQPQSFQQHPQHPQQHQFPSGQQYQTPFQQQTQYGFSQTQYGGYSQAMNDQQRNTEMLFKRPHVVATFGFGGRLFVSMPRRKMVFTSYGATPSSDLVDEGILKVLSLKDVLRNTPHLQSFTRFPGPLKSNTSKDNVINYITMKQTTPDSEDADPEASGLLWGLLKILCTNYGETTQQGDGPSGVTLKAILELLQGENQPWQDQAQATTPHNAAAPLMGPDLEDALNKLHYCLFMGDRQRACHEAMRLGLWSHAMIIASSLGPAAFQDVQKQFAVSSLVEGSPLRSLYLMMAKQPGELFRGGGGGQSAGSGLLDRWRENLAVLLANRSPSDNKVIGSLGDSLWSAQMRVCAAHLCYLMADHPFGSLDNPNARLILIGGDHKTQARTFVNPDSIQRTELFEYAKKLGNSQFTMPAFQVYKFVYATMLADLGILDVADKYYVEIQSTVKGNPNSYNKLFLSQLELFGDRLTFSSGASRDSRHSSTSWFNNFLSKIIGEEDQAQKQKQQQHVEITPPHSTATNEFLARRPDDNPYFQQAPQQQQQQQQQQGGGSFRDFASSSSPAYTATTTTTTTPIPSSFDRQQQQPLSSSAPPSVSVVTNSTPPSSMGKSAEPSFLAQEPTKSSTESPKPASSGGGLWGAIRGVAGKLTGRKANEMLLPETENEYIYHEELKIWYKKGTVPQVEDNSTPPPPTSASMPMPSPDALQASSSSMGGGPPGSATPPVYSRFGGGGAAQASSAGRRRYLDTFNQNSVFDSSQSSQAANIFAAPPPNVAYNPAQFSDQAMAPPPPSHNG